jgi:hypothetical protein
MTLNRARVTWAGAGGLPGLSTFYFDTATTDMTALRTLWVAFAAQLPNSVTITVPSAGDQLQEATGVIVGSWGGPAQAPVPGTGGVGGYSAAEGAMIRWNPNGVVDGRRPLGKTYIVPIISGAIGLNGQISTAVVTAFTAAATTFLGAYAGSVKLWHRKNAKGAGLQMTILTGVCSTKQVVLRSRRD